MKEIRPNFRDIKSFMVNAKTKSRSALSSSADLILHGSRNGWEY